MIVTWENPAWSSRARTSYEVGGDAAPLRWRVEADPVQSVAQRVRDAERLLRLVLERVHEHDPRHVRRHVAVERLGGADRVAEDQHQRVGHRPGRVQPGEPRARRRRGADAAADDRGVVQHVRDVRVDVARAEADDRLRRRGLDALAGGGRPSRGLGEHPEHRGLVQRERAVARRIRRTTSLGVTRSPSAIASTIAPGSSPRTWPSRFVASPMPHRTASSRQKTSIVTTGSIPPGRGCCSARAK